MNINDRELIKALHHMVEIISLLKNTNQQDLAIKLEYIRENIIFAIEDEEYDNKIT